MEVERLTAVLEASGLAGFIAAMGAADRSMGPVQDKIDQLAYSSKVASEALSKVKLIASQAAETGASADFMRASLEKVAATAGEATATLDRVRLGSGAAFESAANGEVIRRSVAGVRDEANDAAAALMRMAAAAAIGGAAGRAGGGGGGGVLSALGWGGGMFGMAGFGSLLGLAGFGAERAITSTLGVAGSLGGAVLGGGLYALGGLGTAAVGIGTDLAGIGQAAGDIKNVTQNLDALQTAIQTYGKNSRQAAQAQAQLNTTLGSFSPVARNAVLAASQTAQAFHQMFNTATGEAEKTGAEIINQAMQVGEKFLPTIGKYAAQNMAIIQQGLQPLFAWLQKPSGGLGIFQDLEQLFQNRLPTAVHAGSQAFEVFLHLVDDAAQHTGGFINKLDQFFTKINTPSGLASMASEVGKLIGLFDTWMHLLGSIGGAIFDLVKPAVGFGQQLAAGLTQVINKVRDWLNLTSTQDTLHSVFAAHLDQLKALFAIIMATLPIIESFAKAFLKVEAVIAETVAGPLKAAALIIQQITRIPFASTIIGTAAAFAVMGKAVTGATALVTFLGARLGLLAPAAAEGAAGADAAVASVGDTAAASAGVVGGLIGVLEKLAALSPIIIAIGFDYFIHKYGAGNVASAAGAGGIDATLGPGISPDQTITVGGKSYPIGTSAALNALRGAGAKGALGTAAQQIAAANRLGGSASESVASLNAKIGQSASSSVDKISAQVKAALAGLHSSYYQHLYGTPGALPSGIPAVGGGRGAGTALQPNAAATNAGNLASYYGQLAGLYTGATAVKYLKDQQAALTIQQAALQQQLKTAGSKNASAITQQLQQTQVSLIQVGQAISNALVVTGSALLPEKLKSKLQAATARFNYDSEYATVLTGQAAQAYGATLLSDLKGRQQDIQAEVNYLKAKLASSSGPQKAAYRAELTKVQANLTTVQQAIVSNLQSTVQALQSTVASIFQNVQSQMDTALGSLYYQNGLQTPSEALLAQMQAQDQLSSLQDAITKAKQQLATDLAASGGPNAATIASDKQQLAAAQRQLVEYNLSIKAAAERAAADQAYAQQVQNLNSDLATLLTHIQNGTGSIADLQAIAKKYGIQIDTSTIPDFANLSTTVGQLQEAIQALISYLGKITGYTPPPTPTPPGGTTATGTSGSTRIPGHGGITNARFGGTVINMTVNGNVLTPTDLADAVHSALLQKQKRTGALGFK